jgi:predicted nuclease of predicted toxin-antitoxin system
VKLLFDENLSFRLVEGLNREFPGSTHVGMVGLSSADDRSVWEFADRNSFIIVSKDSDFHQLSFVLGPQPKVVWVKVGNAHTETVEALLRSRKEEVIAFGKDENTAFLILG